MNKAFAELLEKVCWHPSRYTLSGTFDEAVAFLRGYCAAMQEADPEAASAIGEDMGRFSIWLAGRLQQRRNRTWAHTVQKSFGTDAERLKQLRWLYADFQSGGPAVERSTAPDAHAGDRPLHRPPAARG